MPPQTRMTDTGIRKSSLRESPLRESLVQACKVLYALKAAGDGLGGHLSARLDPERILIKPRPVSWQRLRPEDLIVINFRGKRVDADPDERSAVREWPIHAQIYAARPDVGCVLHAHPAASTLMASLGICVEPLDQDCATFAGRLPLLDNGAVSISTPELGDEVARALGNNKALLLKNHGRVVAAADVAGVCVTAHRLEKVAETMLRAASVTPLPIMSPEARTAVLQAREAVEPAGRGTMDQERWKLQCDHCL